jgi:hypothetical protein
VPVAYIAHPKSADLEQLHNVISQRCFKVPNVQR